MTDLRIRDHWNQLPSAVTQWLLENPGCMILPRTLSAEISAANGEAANDDVHGETTLSQQDMDFIRMKSHEAANGQPDTGYTFFDSVQP
ncbi:MULTISPECIES: hypothetical protein [unclassified Arthrobacter]|jgi:hypothetical protein|uniref:hypothetical protein n=1 Tax=Micrococcaceae TaxID=1268 RepID=UPI00037D2A5E|nr:MULTISPECIES: hypothetical protein [unclassified Arthrobacter]KRE65801.1 hypothetical protein ASG79_11805 [Arthrobacter sp. Soil761]BCW74696.1 hypothetical protein NicSoilB11_10210 [Arthrobacter sp. NicSoilB11]